jgi:hypothetical protein
MCLKGQANEMGGGKRICKTSRGVGQHTLGRGRDRESGAEQGGKGEEARTGGAPSLEPLHGIHTGLNGVTAVL